MDFGKITIPTKWEQVTLKQFQELTKIFDTENRDLLDVLSLFSGKTKNELRLMPKDFTDTMMAHLQFMNTPLNVDPKDSIVINGETYKINYMEKLKLGEFVDSETVAKDKDYAGMLAILCRKEGEIYDDDFIANKLDSRIEMYSNLPITEALIVLNFFLMLSLQSKTLSQRSLETSKAAAESLVQSIEDSLKAGGGKKLDLIYAKNKLRKLKKSLKCI